ncbi:MAG: response regulator transcription factor [Candidatus Taylorbacteria bacterium]|nr:response regulator transcription factor [Candidatus Taylorbacteria bacterium]
MKILIVEDLVELADMLVQFCQGTLQSPEIRVAHTVKSAELALAEGYAPDLVISDGNLPDGKGPSLFPAIRAANPKAFIIFSTTVHGDMLEKHFPGHGADEFLPKASEPSRLVKLLREAERRLAA